MRGHFDQRAAIVIGDDLDSRRQRAVRVHFFDLGLDSRHHVVGVLQSMHDDDRQRHVVVAITASYAEPGHEAHGYGRDILDSDWNGVDLGHDDIFNVLDPVAFQNIVVASVIEQTDASNVHGLLANLDLAPTHVDVGVSEHG